MNLLVYTPTVPTGSSYAQKSFSGLADVCVIEDLRNGRPVSLKRGANCKVIKTFARRVPTRWGGPKSHIYAAIERAEQFISEITAPVVVNPNCIQTK